jgi:hypothetical protein
MKNIISGCGNSPTQNRRLAQAQRSQQILFGGSIIRNEKIVLFCWFRHYHSLNPPTQNRRLDQA